MDPTTNFDERKKFWKFLANGAIHAPKDLRPHLKIDEANFRFISAPAHAHVRDFFLYRVLDEVQKGGISLLRWEEFIESSEDFTKTNKQEQIQRITWESVVDEQKSRRRKLLEVLVELICFSASDSEDYYRHYFLLKELQEYVESQKDRNDFFGFTSRNADYAIKFIAQQIQDLESKGLNLKNCWYLEKQKPFILKPQHTKVEFSSYRKRFQFAIAHGTTNEKSVLGASYGHVYSTASRDIHFSALDSSSNFEPTEFIGELEHCGLLTHAILLRCQIFVGLIPDGWNKEIHALHHDPGNKSAEIVTKATVGDLEKGDFVFAEGDLGEVQEVKVAPTGYKSILVNYIAKRPIQEIESDWFAPSQIQLIIRKDKLLALVNQQVAEGKQEPEFLADLKTMSPETLQNVLRKFVVFKFGSQARLR